MCKPKRIIKKTFGMAKALSNQLLSAFERLKLFFNSSEKPKDDHYLKQVLFKMSSRGMLTIKLKIIS